MGSGSTLGSSLSARANALMAPFGSPRPPTRTTARLEYVRASAGPRMPFFSAFLAAFSSEALDFSMSRFVVVLHRLLVGFRELLRIGLRMRDRRHGARQQSAPAECQHQ